MKPRTDYLTHGVYIVTAQAEGQRAGLAVAWAAQTAPDRVLVCIGNQSATRELILQTRRFGLNLLRADQRDLAFHFGRKSSRDEDKFAGLKTHTGETGAPLLDDCAGSLECEVVEVFETGKDGEDRLVVGRILSAEMYEPDYTPLLYRQKDY